MDGDRLLRLLRHRGGAAASASFGAVGVARVGGEARTQSGHATPPAARRRASRRRRRRRRAAGGAATKEQQIGASNRPCQRRRRRRRPRRRSRASSRSASRSAAVALLSDAMRARSSQRSCAICAAGCSAPAWPRRWQRHCGAERGEASASDGGGGSGSARDDVPASSRVVIVDAFFTRVELTTGVPGTCQAPLVGGGCCRCCCRWSCVGAPPAPAGAVPAANEAVDSPNAQWRKSGTVDWRACGTIGLGISIIQVFCVRGRWVVQQDSGRARAHRPRLSPPLGLPTRTAVRDCVKL